MTKPYTIPTQGKHEELVEEISLDIEILIGSCVEQVGQFIARNEDVERLSEVMGYWSKRIARRAIACSLSAVRDGRLDEELGVVGRVDTNEQGIIEWFEELRDELHFTHGFYPILIAFSAESQEGERK